VSELREQLGVSVSRSALAERVREYGRPPIGGSTTNEQA
jgi:hypothetical protein